MPARHGNFKEAGPAGVKFRRSGRASKLGPEEAALMQRHGRDGARNLFGRPCRGGAWLIERRGDAGPLSSSREGNASALARDGDFALDQEHAILPIDRATPEFGAAPRSRRAASKRECSCP